jgi:hypothetical protein
MFASGLAAFDDPTSTACLRYDVDVCSDLYFFVQLDDVGVVHLETAMRDGAADRTGPVLGRYC